MAKDHPALNAHHRDFIARQHMFFTATAAPGGHINLSPRSTDLFRVIEDKAVVYLDRTGSGNETAAHLNADGRMTIMMCATEGPPLILRLYGKGRATARGSEAYTALLAAEFGNAEPLGARQMIRLDIELVKTSCGYGVPLHDYVGERDTMDRWETSKGAEGLADYRQRHNRVSMDGLPTGIGD